MTDESQYVSWFRNLSVDDVARVGGKNSSLGEMYRELTSKGVRVPNGFAITAQAYRDMLSDAGAWEPLHELLDDFDKADVTELTRRGQDARELVYRAPLSPTLRVQILTAYHELQQEYGPELSLAVRSSATAEDLPTASFAGQHETFLNVRGDEVLLDACRRCFASLFLDRAISYRIDRGFDHFGVALSVGVQKMVRSDLAASGVIFTLDTESGYRDVVFVTGSYGLGENIVQGTVDPDEFYIHKPTFRQGHRAVIRRVLGEKQLKMVYGRTGGGATTRNLPTGITERERYCINDTEVLQLADYAIIIEDHYSARAGEARPMDIEWAKDGTDGELYIVQARPETVASQQQANELEEYRLEGTGTTLVTGRAVGSGIASGTVRLVTDLESLSEFQPGEILVADTTTPDWEPVLKRAAAVVTNRGGRTCHAAIVARELGIPAVVGAGDATSALPTGQSVTISCAEGDTGRVYDGNIPFHVARTNLGDLPRPATRIMLNLGNPELAFKSSFLPNDGVGLARMEFIINESIKAHPMALIHPERIEDAEERHQIERLTRHFDRPADFFVERLSEGVGTIAAAFHPKPVVVRLSDFKTNEYASLLGGSAFEPQEANPMLGFRGASRYAHPAYEEGFALECAAMRRVRETMGFTNVKLMIPFCRRVEEAEQVLEVMASHGLERGQKALEIYLMCEIPNNVVQIDAFARLFDGFSIGSNDLTQLVLGVDRDSEIVAFDFDERDPGVLEMIRLAIEGCRRNQLHSGICGQAPSDYPEFAEALVRMGIDSISLSPDAVLKTTLHILEVEKRLGRAPRGTKEHTNETPSSEDDRRLGHS